MLTVTESACAHLAEMLDEANAPGGAAARFVVGTEGLSLAMDAKKEGDHTFEHGDRTVLLVAPDVSELLTDKTLDLKTTDKGPALTLEDTLGAGEPAS
jgi:Fe-S cluster assembly iron-binding protein IscA